GERRFLEQPVEQRGLAGAEKTGEDGERERRDRPARAAGVLRGHCVVGAALGFVGLACAVFGAAGFVVFAASVLSDFTAEGLASAVLVLSLFLACFFGCLSIAAFASASPLPVGFFGPV